MDITSFSTKFSDLKGATLIVAVGPADLKFPAQKTNRKRQSRAAPFSLSTLNTIEEGRLAKQILTLEFTGKVGTQLAFHPRSADLITRIELVILVGTGGLNKKADKGGAAAEAMRVFGAAVTAIAAKYKCANPVVFSDSLDSKNLELLAATIEGVTLGTYKFNKYKKKSETPDFEIQGVTILAESAIDKRTALVAHKDALATMMARDLINLPPNDCTPGVLVAKAQEIAKTCGYKIDVFDRATLKKMGAGSLLCVAQGSDEPPYLIRMVKPSKNKKARKIAIVGKGVTFDSGGLSIKPAQSMEDMKCDMAGAAAVLGAMQALAADKLDVEVHCYVPTVENMINGKATRPGDIVRAMNGTSIEVLNTDAEGRLILADAVCLAEKDGCEVIVDLATLTGACMVALGMDYAGIFATDEKLKSSITNAAASAGEKLWSLPLPPEYRKLMDSPVADIKNSGPRWGGAITAALFIKEFITNPKTAWAHLDIAGPAYTEVERGYIKKGGVGFGVRTLARWIRGM